MSLPVSFGDTANARTEHITFDVVKMPYPYSGILGRGTINKFKAIVHQLYPCMKIPAAAGVITVRGDQQLARDIKRGVTPCQKNVHNLRTDQKTFSAKEQQRNKEKTTFEEDCEVKKVPLDKHLPDKLVTINATLEPEEEKELLEFLRKNQDVFAWSTSDLRGVSRDIIEHRIDINPNIKPKK